jgi:hypothetical protein
MLAPCLRKRSRRRVLNHLDHHCQFSETFSILDADQTVSILVLLCNQTPIRLISIVRGPGDCSVRFVRQRTGPYQGTHRHAVNFQRQNSNAIAINP